MNSFKKILNVEFNCIKNILVKESNEIYKIDDSLILGNEVSNSKFQIFTNQIGVHLIDLTKEEIIIDGEYEVEEIQFKNLIETEELFTLTKSSIFWDINKIYIIGFILTASKSNLYFIRSVDELIMVDEKKFNDLISNTEHIIEVEKESQ